MNGITYTFPADFKIAQLAGVICTGGKFVNAKGRWQEPVDAVAFTAPQINGRNITAMVTGKPELEAMLSEHLATEAEMSAQKKAVEAAYAQTPRGQRAALVMAEYNSYDADTFPGTAKWMKNNRDCLALEAFDVAHPELVEEIKKEHAMARQARYNGLSDFVKNGS